MRKSVTRLMTGVSIGVVVVAFEASSQGAAHPNAAAPAGIVADTRSRTTTSTAPRSQPTASHSTSVPKPALTSAPRPTAVAKTSAPRPVTTKTTVAAKPSPTKTSTTITVNGNSVDTRYGPVQVQVKIRDGKIIFADAIDYPQSERRDREINSWAVPQLNQETLDAQSANIDTVSGATYTSDGYRESLQSALDAANFGP
jgi:uncharacterized protein with FMN-binding domain